MFRFAVLSLLLIAVFAKHGAEQPIDVHYGDVERVAAFAWQELDSQLLGLYSKQADSHTVLTATKQTVAGVLYRLTMEAQYSTGKVVQVRVAVWVQPDGDNMELLNYDILGSHQDGDLGGARRLETGSQEVQDVADFAVHAVDSKMLGLYAGQADIVTVLHATRQTVNGAMYTLRIQLHYNELKTVLLNVQVHKSTEGEYELVSYNVEQVPFLAAMAEQDDSVDDPSHLMGGQWRDIDVNSDEAQEVAEFCWMKLDTTMIGLHSRKATTREVVEAKRQMVAGVNYKLTMKATYAELKELTFEVTAFRGLGGGLEMRDFDLVEVKMLN